MTKIDDCFIVSVYIEYNVHTLSTFKEIAQVTIELQDKYNNRSTISTYMTRKEYDEIYVKFANQQRTNIELY